MKPDWVTEAERSLGFMADSEREKAQRKQAALIKNAEKRKDPIGRFLSKRPGKLLTKEKRDKLYVSIPLDMSMLIREESTDSKIALGKFLVLLIALGAAQWPAYRTLRYEGPNGEPPVPMPKLVEYILENAVAPSKAKKKAEKPQITAWHATIEAALRSQKDHAEAKRRSANATERVLKGTGYNA